jgi:3-deoxy-D-manno-octulosonate 8-phosphate phosphatase (KDO 8-P phosphatase)
MKRNVIDNIALIVYDFDGVMTDNKVYVDQEGREMVQVNRADGFGISLIKKLGIAQIILSTEANSVVYARAKKLDIPCLQSIGNKAKVLRDFCKENKYDLESVGYVGNDINDLEAMKLVGFSFCPTDAHQDINNISTHVLKTKGGGGVVRELFDFLQKTTITKD